MTWILINSIYYDNYLTSIGYLFLWQSAFNFCADFISENPYKGSRDPKWAITLAVILSSLNILKSGIP